MGCAKSSVTARMLSSCCCPWRITNIQGADVFKNIWIIYPPWSKTTCVFIWYRASYIDSLLLHSRVMCKCPYMWFHRKMPPCRGCRSTGLPACDKQPTPSTLHIHPACSSCLPRLILKNVSETANLNKITLKLKRVYKIQQNQFKGLV